MSLNKIPSPFLFYLTYTISLIYHMINLFIVQENGLIHKIQSGTLCSTKSFNEIESVDECKAAATKLGLKWQITTSGKGDFTKVAKR